MPEAARTPPAVHHQMVVDADPARAFEVFTDIGRWWPLAIRNVLDAGGTVGFVEGQLVERSEDGETAVWGTVTCWAPGVSVALSWHPGRPSDRAGRVQVNFTRAGTQTVVTLEHSGWDGYDHPARARDDYYQGWPRMLGLFRDRANARTNEDIDCPGV